jgi:hypothetical protein
MADGGFLSSGLLSAHAVLNPQNPPQNPHPPKRTFSLSFTLCWCPLTIVIFLTVPGSAPSMLRKMMLRVFQSACSHEAAAARPCQLSVSHFKVVQTQERSFQESRQPKIADCPHHAAAFDAVHGTHRSCFNPCAISSK